MRSDLAWRTKGTALARQRGVFMGIPVLYLAVCMVGIALACAIGYNQVIGSGDTHVFGVIGNGTTHLQEERDAGVKAKLFYLRWREFYPEEGVKDTT